MLPRAVTITRLNAIEIAVNWRWAPILVLGTVLLGHAVVPARFPDWAPLTRWTMSAAVVVAGEVALLLHELSHALVARRSGQEVERIVFHGFVAETVVGAGALGAAQEALVALAGPAMNLVLAALAAVARLALASEGALDVFMLALIVGNLSVAALSALPIGGSDGARAWRATQKLRLPVSARTSTIRMISPSGDQP